jgi:hypothetical protein
MRESRQTTRRNRVRLHLHNHPAARRRAISVGRKMLAGRAQVESERAKKEKISMQAGGKH